MDPSYFFNNNPELFYSSTPPPPPSPQCNSSDQWTFEEDKIFEIAIAELGIESPDLFERIALRLPGKSIEQIKHHFNILVEDVDNIDAGYIPLPDYKETSVDKGKKSAAPVPEQQQQRKKGVLWTDKEHELFLMGLKKYGKGDWRSISRHFVVTRTPTQVASHAQKHFLKVSQNADSASRSKKRSTSEYASTATAMATAPSSHLSGPSAAASMADKKINAYPRYYQNQS